MGLFGGYRFNPVLSAELSVKWGKANLSARDCCIEDGYWLGGDGKTYHAPVAGFGGADYTDLKSAVSLQQYGVRLNVNLFGFFRSLRYSRWRLEFSPMLAALGTKADVKTIAEGKMPDLNCFTLASAMRMVAGTARSLGITVTGEFPENL